ncbi:MAG: hypothetical protein AABX11_07340 [Nanoarchaeota archaeon]
MQKDYNISGGYTHGEVSGTFSGAFRLHDDGRVVGTMNDSGADIRFNRGKTKLIVGISEKDKLNFWKFSPSSIIVPLVYAMNADGENSYRGRWAPIEIPLSALIEGVEGKQGLRELEDAFKVDNLEATLGILSRIEKSRIQSYLDPNLIRDILALSEETGYLSLKEVTAFSA